MKITKWYNSDVVYESKKETMRESVIEAVEAHANLRDANLRGADLVGANLYHANFYGRGGRTKIKTSQVAQFHEALGLIVED